MDYNNIKYTAVICCAGNSKRYKSNKLLEQIGDKFVFEHSVQPFLKDERCDQIILVVSYNWHSGVMLDLMKSGKVSWIYGRETRTNSTREGLQGARNKYVFIHDGCRPLITKKLIDKLIYNLKTNNETIGAVPYTEIDDLVLDKNNKTIEKPKTIMTPQLYLLEDLKTLFQKTKDSELYRDTSTLVLSKGKKVQYILWEENNTKLTTKNNLNLIAAEIKKRES